MNATIIALTGYIAWTLLLLLSLATYRTSLVMKEKRKDIRFCPSGSDVPPLGNRLTRAFGNCVESFAFIGGLMLLAIASNSMEITNPLAFVMLGARLAQSVVHLISTSTLFIQLRFALFLIQFAICVYWVWQFFVRFGG